MSFADKPSFYNMAILERADLANGHTNAIDLLPQESLHFYRPLDNDACKGGIGRRTVLHRIGTQAAS